MLAHSQNGSKASFSGRGLFYLFTITAFILVGFMLSCTTRNSDSNSKDTKPQQKDVTIATAKQGQLDVLGNGDFLVKWSGLSLKYDGNMVEYSFDADLNFPTCPSCTTQLILWVDMARTTCLLRAVNGKTEHFNGAFSVHGDVSDSGDITVYLTGAVENSCQSALAKGKELHKKAIGKITVGSK